MTDKIEPNVRYQFSEPFRTRFEQIMCGVNVPDRSHYEGKAYRSASPPSANQLRYLRNLGYSLESPKTGWEASKLIGNLLREREI